MRRCAPIRPHPVGIPEPLIVGRGINDVPIVMLTLSPEPTAPADRRWNDKALFEIAEELSTNWSR